MPPWLVAALGLIRPITALEPGAVVFGHAVAKELTSADSVVSKVQAVASDLGTFAKEIEEALVANTAG